MSTNVTTNPDEALAELALHDDHLIRAYAAGHPNTSVEILRSLTNDDNDQVRFAVADNPHTPVETLRVMLTDASPHVKGKAVRNIAGRTAAQ